ncbi:MAG TPA: (2Fe-2S)-binding protein [Baekduia sp.]|nr:(2Fe-2S)-binding protein [Baekduia sp.]
MRFTVDGTLREADDAHGGQSLLRVLRDVLGITSAKNACEQGECGSCTVSIDGEIACGCLVLAAQADGARIETAAASGADGDGLDAVQEAFLQAGAVQCGFCTPGLIVATRDFLSRNPDPSEADIREGLNGNLCRCTGYAKIIEAVRLAASPGEDRA